MDYKTFVSKVTAGEYVSIVNIETTYDEFLDDMSSGKTMYYYNEITYSIILSVTITDTEIMLTYCTFDGQFVNKKISR